MAVDQLPRLRPPSWLPLMLGALLPLMLLACGSGEGTGKGQPTTEEIARAREQGPEIYARNACGECHGRNREGTELAPPLTRLGTQWDEEDLFRFLTDPEGWYGRHPGVERRDQELSSRMPGVDPGTPESDARLLARFLLNQE